MTYKRGDVVLVKFPMPDLSEYKPRPALVIQNDNNNKRLKSTILLQITSNPAVKTNPHNFLYPMQAKKEHARA